MFPSSPRKPASGERAYELKPHERPLMPGSPATPHHPPVRRVAYFLIGILFGLAGGFANGLLLASIQQIQGALGLTSTEAGWLTAAYSMTNVCTSLLLIKFRQQFGVTLFARLTLPAFAVVCLAQLFIHSFALEVALRAIAGVVGSGLSSFCLFYIMQGMPAKARMGGMVLGVGVSQIALPLSRVIAPMLLAQGDVRDLFVFELGLALLALAAAAVLPLPPSDRMDAFEPLDLLTFGLFAPGMAMLCAVLSLGRTVWWTTPWLGYALACAIVLIAAAMLVEHNRANPLLNVRWMASADIVQFALIAATMRVLLSEQSFGTAGLLTALGMGIDQLVTLNGVVTVCSVAGIVCSLLVMNPKDLLWPIVVSAALVAIGAWMDSDASNITRPANLFASQGLIAFAATFFTGPLMMSGMLRAITKGPSHIVSFSAVFGISQTLGGLGGSAFLGSLQIARERLHSNELVQNILMTDPQAAGRMSALSQAYGRVLADPQLRQAEGTLLLGQQVTREANVLAYNDVFLVIASLAAIAFVVLLARWLSYRVRGINPLAAELAQLQKIMSARNG